VLTSVEDAAAAGRLAEQLFDGSRCAPTLGVAVPDASLAEQVDTGALAELLPGGQVCLLVGREATWPLKRGLPPGLDVYGRAARLWWPSPGGLTLIEHPRCLLDVRLEVEGGPLTSWVEAQLARGPQAAAVVPTHEPEQQAVVLEVDEGHAVVRLSDGGVAHLPAGAFPGAGTAATRLLRVAQTLRVRVTPPGPGRPSAVTPLWSPGDARARLEAQCPAGSTVRGRVVSLRNHGALVSLLPGVVGLLHVSEVASGWVRHVEDHLARGAVIAVRICSYDQERVALSLVDTAEEPLAPSVLPDGPPWLPKADGPLIPGGFAPLATELPAGRVFDDDPVERPQVPAGDELRLLRDAVHEGREVREDLARVAESHEQHLAGLRAEARQLLRDLEQDLADARERVVTTMSGGASALVGSAEEALELARNEVNRLRRELRTLAEAHATVSARAHAADSRAERAERVSEEQRRRADLHARTAASLRTELSRYAPESQRLVDAIRASWVRTTTPADRERYGWRDPVIGSAFLESLHSVEGVSMERVYDVCAEVVCGRAQQRHGLAVHPLRATDASGSPQKIRDDGALAFRASLQSRTSAARRLHYWVLTDGRVELAKIGYHDDFTI